MLVLWHFFRGLHRIFQQIPEQQTQIPVLQLQLRRERYLQLQRNPFLTALLYIIVENRVNRVIFTERRLHGLIGADLAAAYIMLQFLVLMLPGKLHHRV